MSSEEKTLKPIIVFFDLDGVTHDQNTKASVFAARNYVHEPFSTRIKEMQQALNKEGYELIVGVCTAKAYFDAVVEDAFRTLGPFCRVVGQEGLEPVENLNYYFVTHYLSETSETGPAQVKCAEVWAERKGASEREQSSSVSDKVRCDSSMPSSSVIIVSPKLDVTHQVNGFECADRNIIAAHWKTESMLDFAKRCGAMPGQVIFIDDTKINLDVAREAGIQTVDGSGISPKRNSFTPAQRVDQFNAALLKIDEHIQKMIQCDSSVESDEEDTAMAGAGAGRGAVAEIAEKPAMLIPEKPPKPRDFAHVFVDSMNSLSLSPSLGDAKRLSKLSKKEQKEAMLWLNERVSQPSVCSKISTPIK